MTQHVFESAFNKRVQLLRKALKKRYPDVDWVEGTAVPGGHVTFHLTKKILWHTYPDGTRELTLSRPLCKNCEKPWSDHHPAGEKCLFGPTSYAHDI